ncbi:hypothetical protein EVAR_83415_1 [Eumeta japonica]|uniref:Uncharacterized protein n=1 Tax=Eumeta variegata TaxID=151549 RepID=A0A4C1TYG3_EUMVA|nr:hypothetical protein EVAR_83415_1 [Eumeta japonica]
MESRRLIGNWKHDSSWKRCVVKCLLVYVVLVHLCPCVRAKEISETLQRALSAVRGPSPGAKKLLNIPEDGAYTLPNPKKKNDEPNDPYVNPTKALLHKPTSAVNLAPRPQHAEENRFRLRFWPHRRIMYSFVLYIAPLTHEIKISITLSFSIDSYSGPALASISFILDSDPGLALDSISFVLNSGPGPALASISFILYSDPGPALDSDPGPALGPISFILDSDPGPALDFNPGPALASISFILDFDPGPVSILVPVPISIQFISFPILIPVPLSLQFLSLSILIPDRSRFWSRSRPRSTFILNSNPGPAHNSIYFIPDSDPGPALIPISFILDSNPSSRFNFFNSRF